MRGEGKALGLYLLSDQALVRLLGSLYFQNCYNLQFAIMILDFSFSLDFMFHGFALLHSCDNAMELVADEKM